MSVDALAAQLQLIGRTFDFVSRNELLAAVDGGALPERACVVTFDDGLRCQLEHALPVLDELGVPAVFFVPGLPLAEGRALAIHKLHHLREHVEPDVLAEQLAQAGLRLQDADQALAHAAYRYDEPDTAAMKYLLNFQLPAEQRDAIIDAIFAGVVEDERAFCARLYMSAADVAELERSHSAVGAHSYAHTPLALLDRPERRGELERGIAVLEPLLGAAPRALSYPHGTTSAVDIPTARDAERAGFRIAFTMERAVNAGLDEPCLLARFDANDVAVAVGSKTARTRYFDESAA